MDDCVAQYLRLYSCFFQTTVRRLRRPRRRRRHRHPHRHHTPHTRMFVVIVVVGAVIFRRHLKTSSKPQRRKSRRLTVVQNSQESGRKYRATLSSASSFARAAHLFACFALLTPLARSAPLICSLAHSPTPQLVGK